MKATTGLYTGIRQGCVVNGNMKYWNEFRGIKYGRKPVRFEKPIPKATNNNPQDATKYGSQCVQERFKVSPRNNSLTHETFDFKPK